MQTSTASPTASQAQEQVRRRLEQIWPVAASRDFERLESFHLYGPEFTEFKNGQPRGDAASCAAGERAIFSVLEDTRVEMNDLAINAVGEVAIATFNGHFTGQMPGHPMDFEQQVTIVFRRVGEDWKIIHEHMSPIGGPGVGGPPPGAGRPPQG
jgi:ketosteroid isomerase-like protein